MRRSPRFFSSSLTRRERRIYGRVTLFFFCAFFASLWPVYTLFASIRPLLLGLPLSLFYLIALVLVVFTVLFCLYRWQDRRGELD